MRTRPIERVFEYSGLSPRSLPILLDYADEFGDAQGQLAELVARGHDDEEPDGEASGGA